MRGGRESWLGPLGRGLVDQKSIPDRKSQCFLSANQSDTTLVEVPSGDQV